MPFSTPYIEGRTSDGRNFTVTVPFSYTANDGTEYTVPAGTTTDGASTPRGLWISMPPFGVYWMAAVFHDWLYRFTQFPKSLCDSLLKEAMESLHVPTAEITAIYEGVKYGGWASFEMDRAAQQVPITK